MANRLRQQAHAQAKAEALPQRRGVHRTLKSNLRALRSEEDPLIGGLEAAEQSARQIHGLSGHDRAQLLAEFAHQQADIPASLVSQETSAREDAAQQLADLAAQQSAQEGSIFSQLRTAAAEHARQIRDEEAAEGRQEQHALSQEEAEKQAGLGSYATSPKEEAEIAALQKGHGLTPLQQQSRADDHSSAVYWTKQIVSAAKEGKTLSGEPLEGVSTNPHEWDSATWDHIIGAVETTAKAPNPIATRAVRSVQAHFEPPAAEPTVRQLLGGPVIRNAARAASQLGTPRY